MKFGRFKHQERIFFGIVEGSQVAELDGSPFDSFKITGNLHALSALKTLIPCLLFLAPLPNPLALGHPVPVNGERGYFAV